MIPTTVVGFSNTHGIMGEVNIAVIAYCGSVVEFGEVEVMVSTEECILCQYPKSRISAGKHSYFGIFPPWAFYV